MATQTTDQEKYHVLDGDENGFALAPQTNGRHKKLMRLYLRCAAVDRATKEAICSRFKWAPEEEISSEVSEDAFYAEAAEIVLIGATVDDPDAVVRPEVDRALEDFEQPGGEQGGALSGSSGEGLAAFLNLLRPLAEANAQNGPTTDAT